MVLTDMCLIALSFPPLLLKHWRISVSTSSLSSRFSGENNSESLPAKFTGATVKSLLKLGIEMLLVSLLEEASLSISTLDFFKSFIVFI